MTHLRLPVVALGALLALAASCRPRSAAKPLAKGQAILPCPAHETPMNCMRFVAGGTFLVGAQAVDPAGPNYDPEAQPDEGPVRGVTVGPFWMHHAEVTAGQFLLCIKAGACRREDLKTGGYFNAGLPGRHLHPANGVTLRGARDFCRFIGGRLPTEAEWEWAARRGDGRRYVWGNAPPSCALAVMRDPEGRAGCGDDHTRQVKSIPGVDERKTPPEDFAHLAGNVWERVEGSFDRTDDRPDAGGAGAARGVMRGGAWTSEARELRAAYRAAVDPDDQSDDVGFRCVAAPDALQAVPGEGLRP